MADRNHSYDNKLSQADKPPNSRLFIVGNKSLNEADFREAFAKFGEIEDIWVVKDRSTGESKGVTYIKYTKTSDAANALEAMNGKTLPRTDRNIKVMIASSRQKGSGREDNEDEKIQRLFIVIPKKMTDSELEDHFKQYGEIDYVNIVRDKETRESKGFAYVKYYKFSHAAKAFEECDRKFKAVFSEPRRPHMTRTSASESSNSNNTYEGYYNHSNDKYYRILVIGSPTINEDQFSKLFNIVPGMKYAQWRVDNSNRCAHGSVVYNSQQWASYAVVKLNGFEYPMGHRLRVELDGTVPKLDSPSAGTTRMSSRDTSNLLHLAAETLAHATSVIQQNTGITDFKVGSSISSFDSPGFSSEICSVALPTVKPLACIDSETKARCFIVFTPPPPPPNILKDVFCRFGNLIEVYLLNNKNCGYAKYASKDSAMEAIKLHGADIYGSRAKVMIAEEPNDRSRKRQRFDDE